MDKKVIPPSGQIVKGFGDDLGFDNFDPDRIPSNGKINKGGNPIMGERIVIPPSGQIQASGTGGGSKGAGQLLIPASGQIQGFGDDLGFDDFDPDRIPSSGKIQNTMNPMGRNNKIIIPPSGKINK